MRTVTVSTLDDLDIVLNVTRKEFDSHGKLNVVVKQFEESLSDKQRGLWWRWIGVICADTGDTKEDFHRQAKERIFLPIFLRDETNHIALVQAVNTMKSIKSQVSPAQYHELRDYIIKNVSHLDATVANMAEALKQLESEAISLQIKLPPPPGPGLY
jgi:uncharacterized protein Yka (UPF0111/DUF47 family)